MSNYLKDIALNKNGRLLTNPEYTEVKLVRTLTDSLNRAEDNVAVLICCVSS